MIDRVKDAGVVGGLTCLGIEAGGRHDEVCYGAEVGRKTCPTATGGIPSTLSRRAVGIVQAELASAFGALAVCGSLGLDLGGIDGVAFDAVPC